MTDRVIATYRVATHLDLARVAEIIAGEQSAGTFTRVGFESDELRQAHAATVLSVEETVPCSSDRGVPGAVGGSDGTSPTVGLVRIAFPEHNFGPSIPAVLTTVAGNLYELQEVAGIKLLDVELPAAVTDRYPGPRHGVAGTRRLIGNEDQAMIGTIIKPSIGLSPDHLAEIVTQLAAARIDFIKDDEINSDAPYFPLMERIDVVMNALDDARQRTGVPVMYAFNITGELDEMKRSAERIAERGGTCAMVAIPSIGLPALSELRRSTDLVIHGHRAGFGALDRSPLLGQSFRVFQKLARLAGADHLHAGGIDGKFWESNDEVAANVRAMQENTIRGEQVLPVLSSAQTAATAEPTRALIDSDDLLILAGGGIHAHPGGIADGVESLRDAWRMVSTGRSPEKDASEGSPLAEALRVFGARG